MSKDLRTLLVVVLACLSAALACDPGFFQDGENCSPCPASCATCDSTTNCLSCADGWGYQGCWTDTPTHLFAYDLWSVSSVAECQYKKMEIAGLQAGQCWSTLHATARWWVGGPATGCSPLGDIGNFHIYTNNQGFFANAGATSGACVNSCGSGQYGDSTTGSCQPCSFNCATCYVVANFCTSCPSGSWLDLDTNTCQYCTACGAGEVVATACGFSSNSVCRGACSSGSWLDTNTNTCNPCTACNGAGQFVATACSLTSDAVCGSCPSGSWLDTNTNTCNPCTACNGAGQFVATACSLTSDAVCGVATQQTGPSFTCDASCATCNAPGDANCTSCHGNTYLEPISPGATYGYCWVCGICPSSMYLKTACTPTSQTVCAICDPACLTCAGPTANDCITCNVDYISYYNEIPLCVSGGAPSGPCVPCS